MVPTRTVIRPALTFTFLAAACSAAAPSGTGAASNDGGVTLSIGGQGNAAVRGWCLVLAPEGERRLDIDEAAPAELRWPEARGVRCELEALGGPVTIVAMRQGSRSTTSTSAGGRVSITLR